MSLRQSKSYMNYNIRQYVRVCFTKLRLSSHKFLVESARSLKNFHIHNAHVHSATVMIL